MTDAPALPHPVDSFVQTVNAGDTEAFLAFFPDDGVVDDWGRRFVGHDAIRGWSDNEFIGAHGRMTVTDVDQHDDEVTVTSHWVSNHYTGTSRVAFRLDGDLISEMRISGT